MYRVIIYMSQADRETLDLIIDAVTVTVDGGDFFGTGNPGIPSLCKFLVNAEWSTNYATFFSST